MIDVQIVNHPVTARSLEPFPEQAGAECVFLGRTRRDAHDEYGPLVRLTYHAYLPLARQTLADLADEAVRRFECRAVRIHHATGEVPPGEASVLVQVAGGHRDRAFEACRYLIDRLKAVAPIWKHETWARGESWSAGTPVEVREPGR